MGLYWCQIRALKTISAFTVNLSYNLEPVYSILLAMLIFREHRELSAAFYGCLSLLVLSVLLQSIRQFRNQAGGGRVSGRLVKKRKIPEVFIGAAPLD